MITQLNPSILVETPRGKANAMFLINQDQGQDLQWIAFLASTGECCTFTNSEIRVQAAELSVPGATVLNISDHLRALNNLAPVIPLRAYNGFVGNGRFDDDGGPRLA